ncbi:hypothetical protein BJX64DRAFT_171508 [Aspergillus heterothallicus]
MEHRIMALGLPRRQFLEHTVTVVLECRMPQFRRLDIIIRNLRVVLLIERCSQPTKQGLNKYTYHKISNYGLPRATQSFATNSPFHGPTKQEASRRLSHLQQFNFGLCLLPYALWLLKPGGVDYSTSLMKGVGAYSECASNNHGRTGAVDCLITLF